VLRAVALRKAFVKAGPKGLTLEQQDATVTDRQGVGRASRARKHLQGVLASEGLMLGSTRTEAGDYAHVIQPLEVA
jgi:hypothetical protein